MRPRTLAIGWLAVLLGNVPVAAELVYFVRGGEAQLPATIDGATVRLDTPGGPKSFRLDEFRRIVPGHDPVAEWAGRRAGATRDGGSEARFAASWWALENGLTPEAVALLREGGPTTDHAPTRRALATIEALAAPCPDPDLGPVIRPLRGQRFAEIRSDHVVLLHQGAEAEARERLGVLERVVQTFHLVLAAQGVDLQPPRHRLVSVWFAHRRDYVAFLRQAKAGAFAETQGYFHPTLRAVFAFDTRTGEPQASGRRAVANLRREGGGGPDLERRSLLLDLDWRATDLGIAAHETVHQLTEASGLAPRFDDFPLWLHEGLAAQFEVVRGGRWAGVGRAHDLRLPDWRATRPGPRLAPLLRDSGLGHGYRRDVYAESWALVYFLRKARSREFMTFLDLLRSPGSASATTEERSIEAFRAAFGVGLPSIESAYREYTASLRTPLESDRPSASGGATDDGENRLARPAHSP